MCSSDLEVLAVDCFVVVCFAGACFVLPCFVVLAGTVFFVTVVFLTTSVCPFVVLFVCAIPCKQRANSIPIQINLFISILFFNFECKVTAQKKSDQKNPKKNEILVLLQTLSPNLVLFQRMQLVCGQDLRSFVSKTYTRLWGTLACASGGHLCLEFRV